MNDIGTISLASSDMVESIYNMTLLAFDNYLRYTIYQSPRSIKYLRDIIAQGAERTGHYIFVLIKENNIIGYYHALNLGSEFFLNYIVVTEMVRGLGLGKKLLDHCEATARMLSCTTLSLDVFESNATAHQWYCRVGYKRRSASSVAILAMNQEVQGPFKLKFLPQSLDLAYHEEAERGFSKLECVYGPGKITVGLIADHVCKLLSFEGIGIEDAIIAINSQFWKTRDVLIVSSLEVPARWVVLDSETIIRLSKSL